MSQTPSSRSAAPGIPRWVKISGILVVGVILVLVVLHLTGNSLGGPMSHTMPMPQGTQQP